MFSGADRGRAFGVLGTTVGLGTAIGPLVGGALIALGGPTLGWRLVFFVNIPVGLVVIALSRRAAAGADRAPPTTGSTCWGPPSSAARRSASSSPAWSTTRSVTSGSPGWRCRPSSCSACSCAGSAGSPRVDRDPLVDLRLFRRPSYVSGITLALAFFPAMAGLPLVLALYYQRGLGYTALQSALGVTAYAVGSAVSAPLAGRVVTRIGRPLVVAGAVTFGARGDRDWPWWRRTCPTGTRPWRWRRPLFVMGCGQGMLITPNQTLALMDVDPLMGSTAGGVLQTGQRIGLAIGQALIGAVFFNSLTGTASTSTPAPSATPSSRRSASSRSPSRSACTTWSAPDGARHSSDADDRRPAPREGRRPWVDHWVRRARPPAEPLRSHLWLTGASARSRCPPAGA